MTIITIKCYQMIYYLYYLIIKQKKTKKALTKALFFINDDHNSNYIWLCNTGMLQFALVIKRQNVHGFY